MPSQDITEILLSTSHNLLFIVDEQLNITKSNSDDISKNETLIDYSKSEFIKIFCHAFWQADGIKNEVLNVLANTSSTIANQTLVIEGKTFILDVYLNYIQLDESGHCVVQIANSHDIFSVISDKNNKTEQRILDEISDSFSTDTRGKDFFNFILKDLCLKAKCDYGIIAEVVYDDTNDNLMCLSFAKESEIVENYSTVVNTEFYSQILNGETSIYTDNAQTKFPEDSTVKELNIQSFICQPLKDSNNKSIGLICVMQKNAITNTNYIISQLKVAAKRCEMELHRQRCEKDVEQKNFELKRQNKDMASFTYIASHDLQEPLRKIRMFNSRILEKDGENLSESALSYFSSINSTADRMQKLINALLTYSSMDSDDLTIERVNLNKLLKEVIRTMDDILEGQDVTVDSDDLPTLKIIPLQFQQLLYNVLSNAVKYKKADVPSIIKITAHKELVGRTNFWRIDVADNGIGFDPQYKEKIFEVFQRLHGKQEYAGTGVGLAICNKVAKNHRGFITADGIPGEGATFSIFIPSK